jgi:predicted RNase H-like nuclease (RuvC/YqgF family)
MDYRTLKDIPWDLLVKEGLRLVDTARQAKAERSEDHTRTATSAHAQSSIEALRQRLDAAEAQNRKDAEVAEQMAQQVQRLTAAVEELRGRARLAVWLGGAAFALAAGVLIAVLAIL